MIKDLLDKYHLIVPVNKSILSINLFLEHMLPFQINDPTLESHWRAVILFGKNSATYNFACSGFMAGKIVVT
jgi:hypothetical protein